MIVFFGWGGGKPKDLGAAIPTRCLRCNNSVTYRYYSVTKWFRLYFIPLIPYDTKYFLVCPTCMASKQLDKASRAQVIRLVATTSAMQAGQLSQERYAEQIQGITSGAPQIDAAAGVGAPSLPPPPAVPMAAATLDEISNGGAWAG
jgi:hypothetical protein